MIVCHCNSISEEELREAISNGAEDFLKYSDKSGIGDDCGSCIYFAQALFERFLSEKKKQ
jgi:bacterioferritin-associated ferredoxin|tara:strand:- start:282 stop:461 length:180 start_codon:yes stop_codon:yes gene_type:complete